MNKRDLFIAAMKAGNYKKLAWAISAFSLTRDGAESIRQAHYPYKLLNDPLGKNYCDGDDPSVVLKVDDAVVGEPLYRFKDPLELEVGDIPNLRAPLKSTYGDYLFNWCLVYAFGSKMAYRPGPIKIKDIENEILLNFEDTPEDPSQKKDGIYYVDEYLAFAKAMYYLTGFTQLCVWAGTRRTMLPPPGIAEFRKKLLKENEGHLNEMATIAKIDSALVQYDAEWLKGDPGGDNFIPDFKSRNIVRKKLFLMHGAEMSLDNNTVNAKIITNSLSEGWNIEKFADMNNSLRAGAFNRGAETELGGVSVKWLLRASSNLNITEDDCGSKLGGAIEVTKENKEKLLGFSVITPEGSTRIKTIEDAGSYLGKRIVMRNPMYCRLGRTDFCKVCIGERLSVNPTALSIAVSAYGSSFLDIFMKGSHGKAMTLAKMNLKTAIT